MRWPIRNGLVVPPAELGFVSVPYQSKRTNNHHLYWERQRYQETHRSIFRNLVENVVTLPIDVHKQLHRDYEPPKVPPDSLMIDVIDEHLALNGIITCVRESRTSETYQLNEEVWQHIRSKLEYN